MLKQPLTIISIVIIAAWVILAIAAPWIAPDSPNYTGFAALQAPSAAHWFGTDDVGRDVLSRVLWGARATLPASVILVACASAIGTVIGVVAGYIGGWVDSTLMRITDLFFSFPAVIFAMAIVAALGPSLTNSVIAITAVSWPLFARIARSVVLNIRSADYVLVRRLLGGSTREVIAMDVMPNVIPSVVVVGALYLGEAALLFSGLSFLGLGVRPPTAEWGAMISEGAAHFNAWWMALFPGLALMSIVVAFNLLGDVLRDLLDPTSGRVVTQTAATA